MIKKLNNYLLNKKGMSLVEVLTAMTILTLMIFCFAPLMLSYMETINIAGDKMERVYTDAGNLEVLLGKNSLDGNYTVSVDTVPIKLTSPDATVTVDGNSKNVATATIESFVKAYGLTSGGTFSKDKDGNPADDGKVNISTGQATFYTDKSGSASGITLFPSSLTDDFKVAYITIYSADINFVLSQCKFVTTGPNSEIELKEGVDYDIDYHPDRKNPTDTNILLLTVYGGGDNISFETSPLVFKHMGQRYEIQIDAPSMIMVGEKAPDNNYYYYVSRGEIDTDGSLLIHRRTMETKDDPKGGANITLNSAMNDVEWVSADAGDGKNLDGDNEKYGYYVMCGDQGQVRRFWKRPNTTIAVDGKTIEVDGNYYWGGDYTNHTDINEDEVETGNSYYVSNNRYDTSVHYYFVYRGSNSDYTKANVLGGYGKNYLFNANTFTVNALDTNKSSITGKPVASNIAAYLPDGELYYFQCKGGQNYQSYIDTRAKALKVFDDAEDNHNEYKGDITPTSVAGLNRYWGVNLSLDWRAITENDVYYLVNGLDPNTNMITLTSVDAIQLSAADELPADKKTHYSTSSDGAHGNFGTIAYPTSSYTLYCGYIPAVMDVWTTADSRGDGRVVNKDDNYYDSSKFGLMNSKYATNFNIETNGFKDWPRWKGTYGILAWCEGDTSNGRASIGYDNYKEAYNNHETTGLFTKTHYYSNINFYAFNNVKYAPIGKAFDSKTPTDEYKTIVGNTYDLYVPSNSSRLTSPQIYHPGTGGWVQMNVTAGRVVDITMSYLSHPLAIARTLNPTDDRVYDITNNRDKGGKNTRTFYWNNIRESVTYLDCASAMIPAGEYDIPVSMMVGYVQGGIAEYTGDGTGNDAFVNSIMNSGIVLIRAGTSNTGTHSSDNVSTGEDIATDALGYQLETESNAFHQFYYLNTRSNYSTDPLRGTYNNIGCLSGAQYWLNNRHIQYVATDEHEPLVTASTTNSTHNYLRSHPLSNTKVNCVTWGTSWSSNPVAMWGTDNGTLLSWKCEKVDDDNDGNVAKNNSGEMGFNDRAVVAEFQAYHWVDRVNGKTFKVHDSKWAGSVGSSGTYNQINEDFKSQSGAPFDTANIDHYWDFYDSCSRIRSGEINSYRSEPQGINIFDWRYTLTGISFKTSNGWGSYSGGMEWKDFGFISTLDSINDIEYSDDVWVAVGDQSGKDPATYCGDTKATDESGQTVEAYTGNGGSHSYVNVCYWIDTNKDANHKQATDNRNYQWKAVKISNDARCNIVQINNVNGMWIATGYLDENQNGEFDEGEPARIFWTYDPRLACDDASGNGWSDRVKLYDGKDELGLGNAAFDLMGGINSVATRD